MIRSEQMLFQNPSLSFGANYGGNNWMGSASPYQGDFQCLPLYSSNQVSFAYEAGYQAAISQMVMMQQMQFAMMQGGANRFAYYPQAPMTEYQDPCTGLDCSFQQCLPQDVDSRRLLEQERRHQAELEARIRELEEQLSHRAEGPKHNHHPKKKPNHPHPSQPVQPKAEPAQPKTAEPTQPKATEPAQPKAEPTPVADVKPKSDQEIHAERVNKLYTQLMASGKSMDADSIKRAAISAGLADWEADALITCLADKRGSIGDFTDPRQVDMLGVWKEATDCGGDMQKFAGVLKSYSYKEGTKHTQLSKAAYERLAWTAGSPKGYQELEGALDKVDGFEGLFDGGLDFDQDKVRGLVDSWGAKSAQAPAAADAPPANKTPQEIHTMRINKLKQDLLRSGQMDENQIRDMVARAGLETWEADGLIKCLADGHGTVGNWSQVGQQNMLDIWAKASTANGDVRQLAESMLDYSYAPGTKGDKMSHEVFDALTRAAGRPSGSDDIYHAIDSIDNFDSTLGFGGGVSFDNDDIRRILYTKRGY